MSSVPYVAGGGIGLARSNNRAPGGLSSPLGVRSPQRGGKFGFESATGSTKSVAIGILPGKISHKTSESDGISEKMRSMGISAVYDPNPKSATKVEKTDELEKPASMMDISADRRSFLTKPVSKGMKIMCNVHRRAKNKFFDYPIYECYMLNKDGTETFMMVGQKRPGSKTSNYLLSMELKDLTSKDSENYLGKLRSNFAGTSFVAYDDGLSEKDKKKDLNATRPKNKLDRAEIACITYETNLLFNRGPRVMKVVVPSLDNRGKAYRFESEEKGTLLSQYKDNPNGKRTYLLQNKKPKWNESNASGLDRLFLFFFGEVPTEFIHAQFQDENGGAMRAYCLNFHGRVTKASVKNFQLTHDVDADGEILQFGKVGTNEFTMDFTWPLTPLQAFAVCLSSFDNKKAVD
eukprot:jgi/Bigna1/91650/estExt_fgenesh1_pg.C_1110006